MSTKRPRNSKHYRHFLVGINTPNAVPHQDVVTMIHNALVHYSTCSAALVEHNWSLHSSDITVQRYYVNDEKDLATKATNKLTKS